MYIFAYSDGLLLPSFTLLYPRLPFRALSAPLTAAAGKLSLSQ